MVLVEAVPYTYAPIPLILMVVAGILLMVLIIIICFRHFQQDPVRPRGPVRLLIDGCNGPIRYNRRLLRSDPHRAFTLWHVVDHDNRGDQLDLVPALIQKIREGTVFGEITIYMDGASDHNRPQHRQWYPLDRHLDFCIPPVHEEVDHVIVQQVRERQSAVVRRETTTTCCSLLERPRDNPRLAWTMTRNTAGPGQARRILKRFQLLRPASVYCCFGFERRIQTTLVSVQDTLVPEIRERQLGPDDTVVVTDDVYLRQRIVKAGGLVMTFEQLWELLH